MSKAPNKILLYAIPLSGPSRTPKWTSRTNNKTRLQYSWIDQDNEQVLLPQNNAPATPKTPKPIS